MWPTQKQWWDLPNFIRAFVGGFGSGKTLIGAKWAIGMALQNAPVPMCAVSPTFNVAKLTSVATIKELLAGKRSLHGRNFWWNYNKSDHLFTIKFRGRTAYLVVYSAEHPDALRGPNLCGAWFDEPFIQARECFDHVLARVRHPRAVRLGIGLTGTPEQLNWGYELCEGEQQQKLDVGVVRAPTTENKALPEGYVERLTAAFTERAAMAYVHGRFVNLATGLIYYGFDPGKHVVDVPMPDGAALGVGMDFNVNPFCTVVFWRYADRVHFMEEVVIENTDTQYMASVLREKYPHLRDVYPDATGAQRNTASPAGASDFTFLKRAGFEVHAVPNLNPPVRDRHNAVNVKFKPQRGEPTLTISPNCRRLKSYLQQFSHEEQNTKAQRHMGHLLDAFSYPVAYLFPTERPQATMFKVRGF